MELDLEPLKRKLLKRTGEEDSVWPCFALTLYTERAFPAIGPAAASALRYYLSSVQPGTLQSCLIEDDVRSLSSQRISKDIKRLEAPRKGDDGLTLVYSSSPNGAPGDFGVHFALLDLDDPELVGPSETNVLRFEWPWHAVEGEGCERIYQIVVALIDEVPCSAATAGFGFSYWREDRFAADQVQALLARYAGFDHSDLSCNNLRGNAPAANWLTYVDGALAAELDDIAPLPSFLSAAVIRNAKSGRLIRAALRPPVGDINRGSQDIGYLPTISRWLRPRRFTTDSFAGTRDLISAPNWIARFDERQDEAWENRP